MVASGALLTFRLDNPLLWADEIFTSNYIRNEYKYLLDISRPDERHPPGHYIVLKAWTQIFGSERISLRSLSVVWAIICLPLIYGIVRLRFDRRTAIVAALLLALFPGFIHYARESRMYAQIFALLLLASFFYMYLFSRFNQISAIIRAIVTILYAIFLASTFYTHYISSIFFVCFFLSSTLIYLIDRNIQWFTHSILGLGLATMLVAPQIFHMIGFVAPSNDEWIPYSDLMVFYSTVSGAYDIPRYSKPVLYLAYVFGLFILWSNDRPFFVFLFSFMVIGPVVLALLGAVRPLLLVRTVQPFTLLSPILIALILTRSQRPWVGAAVIIFAILSYAATFSRDFPKERESLFSETARAELNAMSMSGANVFFIEHLAREFELVEVDYTRFVPIGFDDFEEGSARFEASLEACAVDEVCMGTYIILEDDPLFEKRAGQLWSNFVLSLGPTDQETHEGYTIYAFR